ncbi:hypothetical protein LguiA_006209 [Lonicera macranthoides]
MAAEHNTNIHVLAAQERLIRAAAYRLSRALVGDDGRVYTCLERNLLAFESNGSIAWTLSLNYTCNAGIVPVHGGARKLYLVAENRVLKISTRNIGSSEFAVELFFGPEPGEIIGLSVSTSSSCVLINVKNRGLFAYRLHGQLLWSAGPVLYQSGYRQGCRKNVTECYFTSVPVIDHCEASIYMSNNEGELYALSVRSPHFKWIQDFSSLDKIFTVTPGNNGRLYVTIPVRALVLALDVFRGTVLWQRSIGPLSSMDIAPVVDTNGITHSSVARIGTIGWISIGSLDGFLYSFSPTGILKKFPKAADSINTVVQVSPLLDCSGYAVYISRTEMEGKISHTIGEYTYVSAKNPINVIFSVVVPATGSMYWSESYTGDLDFLVRSLHPPAHKQCPSVPTFTQRSLQLQKKAFDKTITELEQRASEKALADEVLEKMANLVRERDGIERKLSTTYSLGRDKAIGSHSKSLLPLYDGKTKTKSYSFQGAKKENVTIFHTLGDTSSSGDSSSDNEARSKGKSLIEVASSSEDSIYESGYMASPSGSTSGSKGVAMDYEMSEPVEMKMCDEGLVIDALDNGSRSMRRRAFSSTI